MLKHKYKKDPAVWVDHSLNLRIFLEFSLNLAAKVMLCWCSWKKGPGLVVVFMDEEEASAMTVVCYRACAYRNKLRNKVYFLNC